MKKYIRSSKYVFETPYLGYCFYTAGNETWGYDARRILHHLGGKRGYVKFPKGDDSYFRPNLIYMFSDESMYNDFIQDLKSHDLLGLIKLYDYEELPENAIIVEED